MRKTVVFWLVLILTLTGFPWPVSPQSTKPDPICSWPMLRGNPENTGFTRDCGPFGYDVIPLWSARLGGVAECFSSAVASDGKTYISSEKLYCFDAISGKQIWVGKEKLGRSPSTPALFEDKVYTFSNVEPFGLYCYSAEKGNSLWLFKLKKFTSTQASPIIADGKIFFGTFEDEFFCVDAKSGKQVWKTKIGGFVYSTAAVSKDFIYFGCGDNNVYCLNAKTGAVVWKFQTGGYIFSSPAIWGDRLFIGSYDKKLYCLETKTGKEVWSFETEGKIFSSPAVSGKYVVFGSGDHKVYCLNADKGKEVWSYLAKARVDSCPTIARDRVYVGSDDGSIYCLTEDSGSLLWSYATACWIVCSPAIYDKLVFVGSYGGYLYCLGNPKNENKPMSSKDESFLASDLWLCRRGNPQRTGSTTLGPKSNNLELLDRIYGKMIYNISSDVISLENGYSYSLGVCSIYASLKLDGSYKYLWSDELIHTSHIAFSNDKVYVTYNHSINCYDAKKGKHLWFFNTAEIVKKYPIAFEDKIFLQDEVGELFCFNSSDGKGIWMTRFEPTELDMAAGDGKIFVPTNTNTLTCFDVNNGDRLWEFQSSSPLVCPPSYSNGRVYTATKDGNIYMLDSSNGGKLWDYKIDAIPIGEIVIRFEQVQVSDNHNGISVFGVKP